MKQELLKQTSRGYPHIKILVIFFALLSILVLLGYEGYVRYQQVQFMNQIPAQIKDSAEFPIYLPADLPKGFRFSKESVDMTPAVITYYLEGRDSKKLIFTLQPKPTEIKTEDFGKERLLNSKEMTISIGKASIGTLKSVQTASVVTDETWILITAPEGIKDKDLRTIIRGLEKL